METKSYTVRIEISAPRQDEKYVAANQFIDAFYSFDRDSVKVMLAGAEQW